MKKYLFLFLLMLLPGVSWAADPTTVKVGDYLYTVISNQNLRLAGVKSSVTEITVPATVTDNSVEYKVAAIASKKGQEDGVAASGSTDYVAIHDNTNITKVTFATSSNCKTISNNAFENCTALATVENATSVTMIRSYAFNGCTSLRSISLDNVETVETYAFYKCALTSLTMLKVKSIGDYAFDFNPLKTIEIDYNGSDATSIGKFAFADNAELTTLYSGFTTTEQSTWEPSAFDATCSAAVYTGFVENAISNNKSFKEIYTLSYKENSKEAHIIKIGGQSSVIDFKPAGTIKYKGEDYTITTVGDDENENTVSTTIASIGGTSSEGNPNLTLPSSVTKIASFAFNGNPALTTVSLQGVKTIGTNAFRNNKKLETVNFGNSLESIGNYAFGDCTNLTEVNIVGDITKTTLGDGTFYASGIKKLHLENIKSIGYRAFWGTYSLESVDLDNCGTLGNEAFHLGSANASLKNVNLDVTTIGKSAFSNRTGIAYVTIGSRVTSIGELAFASSRTSLKEFTTLAMAAPNVSIESSKETFGSTGDITSKLFYPTGATGYTEAPWTSFSSKTVYAISFIGNESLLKEISAKAGDAVKLTNTTNTDGTVAVAITVSNDNESDDFNFTVTPPTGKKFSGWKSKEATLDSNGSFTMPTKAVTLDAQFVTNSHTVTFKYKKDGEPVTVSTSEIEVGTKVTFPTLTEYDGYTHPTWNNGTFDTTTTGYEKPSNLSLEGFTMPDANVEVTVEYTAKEYTVTYVIGDNKSEDATKYTVGKTVTISETLPPNKEGKTWAWTSSDVEKISSTKDGDNIKYTFEMPAKNVTITATATDVTYSITYNYYADFNTETGKSIVPTETQGKIAPVKNSYAYNAVVTPASVAVLATEGYKVTWEYYEDADFTKEHTLSYYGDGTFNMPAMNLYAKPIYKAAEYTVKFVSNGVTIEERKMGTADVDTKIEFDLNPANTTDAVPAGKTFTGWTSSDVTISEGVDSYKGYFTMPAKDVTITAQFATTTHTLTYEETNPVDNKVTTKTSTVAEGATVTVATPTTTIIKEEKDGTIKFHYFNGWTFSSGVTVTKPGEKFLMPKENVKATANYSENASVLASHKLTIMLATDLENPKSIVVYTGQNIKDAIAAQNLTYDKVGYTWALSDNISTISGAPTVMPDNDLTLYVHYTAQKFTITYRYTKDGNTTTYGTDTYSAGETVTPRTAPTFDGYSFSGWTSIPSKLTENITVTGSYTKNEYILTFEVDGEVYKKTEGLTVGSAITVPAAPVKSGYIFSGWQWPDNKVLSSMPASNLTVSGYFYQSEQKVTDNESGLAFDVAVTSMNGTQGSVTLTSVPEAVLKGEKEIPSQISAAGKTYTVTKVNAAAFDNLAEGVIVYLPQTAATTADVVNVVNNGSKVKTLDLSQVKKFALPSTVASVTANEVKYTRTISGSSTVVTMPYEVAVPKGFKAYTLKGANSQKKAQFEEYTGEKMAAYTPYLLVKQSGEVAGARALLADDAAAETETTIDLSAKNVTIVPEPENAAQGDDQMSLSGTVSAISNDRGYIFGMYKLQADGSWDMTAVENDPSEYIAAFSGYLTVTNQLIEGKVEGTTAVEPEPVDPTGINAVDAAADSNASNDVWYDMRGRRLQGEPTQKGIYIKNGKKFVKN